jgi:AcrR family transcriptional regulator
MRKKPEKKPVRPPQQERSIQKFDFIVEAATRILSESGYAALTTNEVAKISGVSIGSVYEYFRNKDEIVLVIVDRHLTAAENAVASFDFQDAQNWSLEQVVNSLVSGFIVLHKDDPRLHRVLSSEVPLTKQQLRRRQNLEENLIFAFASVLKGRVPNPAVQGTLLVQATDSLIHKWLLDFEGAPLPADVMQLELEKMLLSYLASEV